MTEETKSQEKEDQKNTGRNIWAVIGKASAILSPILATIAVYTFFFPERPVLSAKFYESTSLLPDNTISNLEEKVNSSMLFNYIDSLPKSELDKTVKDNEEFIRKLNDFEDKKTKENHLEFNNIRKLRQKIRIRIDNSGTKEAQSINIDLPRSTTGFYQVDFLKNEIKPFEKTIQVGTVRPSSTILVEIWVNDESISASSININYPEGTILLRTPYDIPERDWIDDLAKPAFILENLFFVILILILVISTKIDEIRKKEQLIGRKIQKE